MPTTPSPPPAERKLSPEVAWYLASRGIPAPTCPPAHKTPEPGEVNAGCRFDAERVDHVRRVFALLRHTQGKWAGRALELDPWQIAYIIAPVFGWLRRNDDGEWVRAVRTAYIDVPRKNGKTTLAGGLATLLTCADGEAGAQVFAVAAGKDQARYCFDPVRSFAMQSPDLAPHVHVTRDRIIHPATGSYFAVVSSVADLLHGANIHGAVIDELHVHKTSEIVDAVESGTGARSQSLIVTITTADDGRPATVYARRRAYIESLARGALTDPSAYGVVWCAGEGDDEYAESTWAKANPGYGISPTREFMESAAARAKGDPADHANFCRLHLGLRVRASARYIALADWDASAGLVDEQRLVGRACHGGLDLASVEDLTALCWLFPDGEGGFDVVWRFWLPEDRYPQLRKRTADAASRWVREGWLRLTPGNVIDNEAIVAAIGRDAERFAVRTIGFDRWGATDAVRQLQDGGLRCVGVGQGYASQNAPLKETLRLVLEGRLRHGGNPVMRWMVDNLAVATDPAGNCKPDKAKSADKIDGVSALANALKEHIDNSRAERVSAYEESGLEVV